MAFTVRFKKSNNSFVAKFASSKHTFPVRFGTINTITSYVGTPYDGSYEVTPKVESQVLPTAQKTLLEDITVKEIPLFEVSNNSGGKTIYIGNEV